MNWPAGKYIHGKKLNHLRYADDVVTIASALKELKQILTSSLARKSQQVGQKPNYNKIEIMKTHKKLET